MEQIAVVAALSVGGTFLISGLGKLRDFDGFILAVVDYQIPPRRPAVAFTSLLPAAEILYGVL